MYCVVTRGIAFDEAGCLTDRDRPMSVVGSMSSHRPFEYQETSHEKVAAYNKKPRGKVKSHRFREAPFGSYRYVLLELEHIETARLIYGEPQTDEEISWNGKFYEFRLRYDAILRLMEESGFDPRNDKIIIDAFQKPGIMMRQISLGWQRQYGDPIARSRIECKTKADEKYPIVNAVDENANRLLYRFRNRDDFKDVPRPWEANEVQLTADDMMRFNLNRHRQREARKRIKETQESEACADDLQFAVA